MYADIISTISFIAKRHPLDAPIYQQGRSLQKHFDALWHEAFPDRVKSLDFLPSKSKGKSKSRPPGSSSKHKHTLMPDETSFINKTKKRYQSRSPTLSLDELHDKDPPKETYIDTEQKFNVPSPTCAPEAEFFDRISLSPQPPETIPSKKYSNRHMSPSPVDLTNPKSPSDIPAPLDEHPSPLSDEFMHLSPAKSLKVVHTEPHRGRQKNKSSKDDLFAEFSSPPAQQLPESRHRSKNRSPSEHSEDMFLEVKTKKKHRRTPQHEVSIFYDAPQSSASKQRYHKAVTPIRDEVVQRRPHKHSRGDTERHRSRKKSLSPLPRQLYNSPDSPHSRSRHRPRQRELSPEVPYQQWQMPGSPDELFPVGLTPGVLPQHRSKHAIESQSPFDPTPTVLSREQSISPDISPSYTSRQRIYQEEALPTRKIKLKLRSVSPKRKASRHRRSGSPRERASSSVNHKHRKRSPSPVYDYVSPGRRHKHKSRHRSPSPLSDDSAFEEPATSINHRNKHSQLLPSSVREEPIPQRRSKHQRRSPSPVSDHFDPPSRKQKPPSKEKLYAYCKRALDELDNHPSSPSFRLPVDPVLLGIPNYLDVVKHPMDLRTIRTQLEAHQYTCFEEFDHDVLLITDNACLFNKPETWVHTEAVRLREHYLGFKAGFNGHFLSHSEVELFRDLLAVLSQGSFIQTFNPPTQFCRYMPEPIDVDRLGNLLGSDYFFHLGEVEKSFKAMLMTAYSFFSRGSVEFKSTLRLEKHYTSQFSQRFKRPSLFMGNLSQEEPWLLMTPERKPQCMQIIKKLLNMKAAFYFAEPVDYVGLQLPHYPTIIRQPMDLGTIKKKLTSGAYCTLDQFEYDVLLIVRNCYNFNGIECSFSAEAKKLEVAFKREWAVVKTSCLPKGSVPASPAVSKAKAKLPPATLQQMQAALNAIKSFRHYEIFGSPVDYVSLNIPQYPQIIKEPMDFGTIQAKLKAGSYLTVDAFLKDANLVFINCFKFNFPGDPVYVAGQDMEREWESICQKKGLQKNSSYLSTEEISIISPKVTSSIHTYTNTVYRWLFARLSSSPLTTSPARNPPIQRRNPLAASDIELL
ncbi:hypothetical protein DSO57_1037226 [Entomophthora muscae]|uniref:Uncharacterized protein n=1 Tax=Entomophthora muscae TaxID=34485 RepID=A0ACC2U8Z4_9FUNG|nr:hypothetical protein DSO57_1037226 [Entomophthora muscae]